MEMKGGGLQTKWTDGKETRIEYIKTMNSARKGKYSKGMI
jgi:hypothetical protein